MIEISSEEKNFLVNKIVGCIIFAVFGTAGFLFSLWIRNWNSALWNFLLGICCTAIIYLNAGYIRNELRCKGWVFFFGKCFATLLFLGGIFAAVSYIALAAVNEEPFDMNGKYVAAPVSILTSFWSIFLFLDCGEFQKYVRYVELQKIGLR